MTEMHLKQPGFTYSACGPSTKNKERTEKLLQTGNTNFIHINDPDKACFQHDMAYGESKALARRTEPDKILRDKAFKIASNPKYDRYKKELASMVYNFFDKKSSGSGVATEPNYHIEKELDRQIIRTFKREKVISSFFVRVKDKRGITIVNAFQKIIWKGCKPNKIWIDQGGEFYNILFKRFLKTNNIETCSTHIWGKSVVAERFIRTFKNKLFKHKATVSKNVYFDVLEEIVNKYNSKVHGTIKMKPIDVKSDFYAEYNENSNEKDPIFKVGNRVRISKYKNIFPKGYTANWSEEVFVISKIKNTIPWTYVISDLSGTEITGIFYEKELQKTNQKEFRTEKVIKRKGDKLFVKWKGYDNSFNSWIDKNDVV